MTKDSLFLKGIEEFNNREFFESHESLEDYWRTLSGHEKELVQSIIQAAVAFYHMSRGNPVGAQKLLTRAVARARSVPEGTCEIDIPPYLQAIEKSLKVVEESGTFDQMTIPTIRFSN